MVMTSQKKLPATRRSIKLVSSNIDDEEQAMLLEKSSNAGDEDEGLEVEEEEEAEWTLHIRCATAQQKELDIRISAHATIKQLQEIIVQRLAINEETHNARLIYQGKLLSNSLGHVLSSEVKNRSYIHVAISPKISRAAGSLSSSSSSSFPAGAAFQASGNSPLRGLDLLRDRNPYGNILSAEEVLILRSYFHDAIQQFARQQERNRNVAAGESEEDYQYRLEREWMEAQGPSSELGLNLAVQHPAAVAHFLLDRSPFAPFFLESSSSTAQNAVETGDARFTTDATTSTELGTYLDFFYGVALGYMIGFIIIFCIWDRNISHRQKLGLLIGIILQVLSKVIWTNFMDEGIGESSNSNMDYYNNNNGENETHPVSVHHAIGNTSVVTSKSMAAASLRGSYSSSDREGSAIADVFERGNENHPLFKSFPFSFSV